MGYEVEIFEPGVEARTVTLTAPAEVGRQTDGIRLLDPSVSRRHLRLEPTADGIVVTDLGSRSGTIVNGYRMEAPVLAGDGDWLVIGNTQLRFHHRVEPDVSGEATPQVGSAVASASPGNEPDTRPTTPPLYELAAIDADGAAIIRFRRGSAGERAAKPTANAVKRARKRLEGFGSEAAGIVPTICLVDPFPDPDQPDQLVTEGTIVDVERAEIWMVVTSEAPPEPPERPLALLFGAALPAAAELEPLIEGYGAWLAKAPDPDPQLKALDLPPLPAATGELRSAMALSFVRFLIAREKEEGIRRLFASAQPGRVEVAIQEIYGLGLPGLDRAWREQLSRGGPKVRTGQFLRMSVRYLRPYKWKQAEIFLYMLFALAFNTVFPFVTRTLFDTALPSGEFSQVLRLLIGLGIAFLVSLFAGLRQAYLSAWVSGAVVRDMRAQMFEKLQTLSTGWFRRHQQGDVLTRLFSDVGVVEQGLTSTLRDGIFQVLSLVVSAIVMLTLNLWLGLLVLAAAPLVALVYRAMSAGARDRGLAVQEDTAALMGVAAENYSAEPVVKLFGLQHHEIGRFNRLSARLFRSERRLSLFGGLFGLSVNTIVTFLRLAVLGIGAWMILDGRFTVGGLVAFLGIMGEVLAPVTVLTGIGQQVQSATGALHRIDEVADEPPEYEDHPDAIDLPPLAQEVRLENVDFSYNSERQVLNDVSATIPAGARVAFVGASGSGKSTTLQLLMRLYDVDSGRITWDGIDIRSARVESLRGQLGVVFQDSFLFDTTVRENIALGKLGATDEEVEAAARAAEVHDFISALPRGYDTVVGERGGLLSGGQRQRVAIARALVRNPRVLLLDEATSALDPKTERQITETLNRISAGRTTIAITHRLTSVVDYDRIFVMSEGQLVEQGTHEELVARGGVYARLWSEQTGQAFAAAGPPPFDAASALARLSLFAGLSRADLDAIVARAKPVSLPANQSIPDGDGSLSLIASGRGRVLVPALGGGWAVAAEVSTGDSYGLSALLAGSATGAYLQAIENLDLLVLDDEAFAGIAASYPTVAAGLAGHAAGAATAAPEGGRRLTRMTTSMRAEDVEAALAAMRSTG